MMGLDFHWSIQIWLSWNSLCRPSLSMTHRDQSAGIQGVHHPAWIQGFIMFLFNFFNNFNIEPNTYIGTKYLKKNYSPGCDITDSVTCSCFLNQFPSLSYVSANTAIRTTMPRSCSYIITILFSKNVQILYNCLW